MLRFRAELLCEGFFDSLIPCLEIIERHRCHLALRVESPGVRLREPDRPTGASPFHKEISRACARLPPRARALRCAECADPCGIRVVLALRGQRRAIRHQGTLTIIAVPADLRRKAQGHGQRLPHPALAIVLEPGHMFAGAASLYESICDSLVLPVAQARMIRQNTDTRQAPEAPCGIHLRMKSPPCQGLHVEGRWSIIRTLTASAIDGPHALTNRRPTNEYRPRSCPRSVIFGRSCRWR